MKAYLKQGFAWSVACASALVLAFTLTTAGSARAGNFLLNIEGGTTDTDGDTGHLVIGGIAKTNADGSAKSLDLTISYEDNVGVTGVNTDGFVCHLTNPADFTPGGGGAPSKLTVSAGDPLCFRMTNPADTFSNEGNSIDFKGLFISNRARFVATSSTLVDSFDDIIENVALAGEANPSGAGSNQAGGKRLIIAEGGAVDTDDHNSPSGHMAIAGGVELQPIRKNEKHAEAKALDLRIEYEDFVSNQHLSCHLSDPSDVSYSLANGVGTITFTVAAGDSCSHANTGNSITFALYAAGSKGRIVSIGSTLVDSDGDTIGDVAVIGEISTPGGSD